MNYKDRPAYLLTALQVARRRGCSHVTVYADERSYEEQAVVAASIESALRRADERVAAARRHALALARYEEVQRLKRLVCKRVKSFAKLEETIALLWADYVEAHKDNQAINRFMANLLPQGSGTLDKDLQFFVALRSAQHGVDPLYGGQPKPDAPPHLPAIASLADRRRAEVEAIRGTLAEIAESTAGISSKRS